MKYQRYGSKIIVRLERGEEIVESLSKIVLDCNVKLGQITGLGACSEAVIGNFDVVKKEYNKKTLHGSFEITNLYGNISQQDDKPYLHLHITLGDEKLNCRGGHLNSAIVSATAEIIIDVFEGMVERYRDNESGLNFWEL